MRIVGFEVTATVKPNGDLRALSLGTGRHAAASRFPHR
jgi:hypothetical protein